jgi:peptidylprolyl isomerase/FKBP-type peptidyl-prolyl cis-trans isomerase FklB
MTRSALKLCLIAGLLTLGACSRATADPATLAEGRAFLAQNAKAPGVTRTRSGLEYKVLVAGPADGPHPGPDDAVKVNYEVKLLNGQVIDSSFQRGQPDVMRLGGLIGAWKEALRLMRPGDTWEIWSPPELAYGDEETGPIPGGSVLEFKIELIATAR